MNGRRLVWCGSKWGSVVGAEGNKWKVWGAVMKVSNERWGMSESLKAISGRELVYARDMKGEERRHG